MRGSDWSTLVSSKLAQKRMTGRRETFKISPAENFNSGARPSVSRVPCRRAPPGMQDARKGKMLSRVPNHCAQISCKIAQIHLNFRPADTLLQERK